MIKLTNAQRKVLEKLSRSGYFLEWNRGAGGLIWPGGYRVQPSTLRNLEDRSFIAQTKLQTRGGDPVFVITAIGREAYRKAGRR